jgi:hypothetical protein
MLFLIVAVLFAEPPDMPDAGRAGLWHAMPIVASGYAGLYALFEDGTFLWRESEMDWAARLRERSGSWRVEGDTLVLTVSSEMVWEGGTLVPAAGSAGSDSELTGFTEVYYDYAIPGEVRLGVSAPEPAESEDYPDMPGGMRRMIIGGKDYWLLSSDPGTILNLD